MKILFVAQNFQMGGIQKALINTLKELNSNSEYEIDVFSFGKGILMSEIPPTVNVYTGNLLLELVSTPFNEVKNSKNLWHITLRVLLMFVVRLVGSKNLYKYLFKKQKKFKKYDIAISYFNDVSNNHFNQGTNLFVDEFTFANRKFAWIHTDPIEARFDYHTCLKTYKNFDRLLCVSEACKQKFVSFLPEYQVKTKVVYNFFPIKEIKEKSSEFTSFEKGKINIVSVGRIDNATKRFNLIPYLCKMLKDASITNFRWRIVGDGPDLDANRKLVKELGVDDIVTFIGESSNPFPYIKHSDILILTSAYEGYPMVIGEALVLNTPVITTNFAASSEQIRSGYNGIITGQNIEDIFRVIKNVLEDPKIIEQMKDYIMKNQYSNNIAREQLSVELNFNYEN